MRVSQQTFSASRNYSSQVLISFTKQDRITQEENQLMKKKWQKYINGLANGRQSRLLLGALTFGLICIGIDCLFLSTITVLVACIVEHQVPSSIFWWALILGLFTGTIAICSRYGRQQYRQE